MPQYRRLIVPGASYFFTVALADRHTDLLVAGISALRRAFAQTLADRPVRIDAMVVLPDHLHAVWMLPDGDGDFAARWRIIKARFARAVGGRSDHQSSPPAPHIESSARPPPSLAANRNAV